MGYLRHECLVVSHWDDRRVGRAHDAALRIFGDLSDDMGTQFARLVSPLIRHAVNGGAAFFVAPDGSKEGWEPSNLAEEARAALIAELRKLKVDWALILLGGDDERFEVLQSPTPSENTDGR